MSFKIKFQELPDSKAGSSQPLVTEQDTSLKNRCNFLNDYKVEFFFFFL